MGRIFTALITITLNLFLGFFRDYIFYIYSLFSNSLSQITAIGYTSLNMNQNIEGVYQLGIGIIFAIISLHPAIRFLKWLNKEVSEQDIGLNLILALLVEFITLLL
jgi:hypothetical protein